MKKTLSILVAVVLVGALSGGALAQAQGQAQAQAQAQGQAQPQAAPAQTAAVAGDARAGRDLYLRYSCYACHGYAGHGGAGARLVPQRMSLPSFTAYVRSPRQMPPYTAKVLSDAQVADVWAYIQTLPKSPGATDIPLLAQILSEK